MAKPNNNVSARFTPEDKELLELATRIEGYSDLSSWVRHTLVQSARDIINSATPEALKERAREAKDAIDSETAALNTLVSKMLTR